MQRKISSSAAATATATAAASSGCIFIASIIRSDVCVIPEGGLHFSEDGEGHRDDGPRATSALLLPLFISALRRMRNSQVSTLVANCCSLHSEPMGSRLSSSYLFRKKQQQLSMYCLKYRHRFPISLCVYIIQPILLYLFSKSEWAARAVLTHM